jgi:uncharacterized protein YrrD
MNCVGGKSRFGERNPGKAWCLTRLAGRGDSQGIDAGPASPGKVLIMFHGVKELLGYKLGATDGEIGHVKDFYFDDKDWTIRYIVADTGSWLPGRQVLISPYAVGHVYPAGRILEVKLTRDKVQKSQDIDTHLPVSRQHEIEYYKYYNWPVYWGGPGLWGLSAAPLLPSQYEPVEEEPHKTDQDQPESHLRSVDDVTGYTVHALDGDIGKVEDFLIDDSTWAIESLIVATGHWWSGRKSVLVPPGSIRRVSWSESRVFVELSRAALASEPEYVHSPSGQGEHDPKIFR